MIKLKIGRHEYEITDDDTFMDNGSCVQLTSQSKERWGQQADPVLSKRAVKEIADYERMQLQHGYGSRVQIFSLSVTSKGGE